MLIILFFLIKGYPINEIYCEYPENAPHLQYEPPANYDKYLKKVEIAQPPDDSYILKDLSTDAKWNLFIITFLVVGVIIVNIVDPSGPSALE